jgi:transposase
MIKIHLGKNQKEKVEELYRSTNSPRLKERYQALLLADEGWLSDKIRRVVRKNILTVRRWLRAYQKSGLPGLNIGHGPGRPAKISKKQKQSLVKMAAKSPRFSGYEFNIWTCRHLGIFLNQRFKVKLSPERIRQILHDEDIVMKKPTYLYLKQKPKKKKTICQGN